VPEQHLFHFSPETLTALAEAVGFSVALGKAVGGTDLLRREASLVPGWVKRQVGRHLEVFLPLQRVVRRLYHSLCGGAQFVRLYARSPQGEGGVRQAHPALSLSKGGAEGAAQG